MQHELVRFAPEQVYPEHQAVTLPAWGHWQVERHTCGYASVYTVMTHFLGPTKVSGDKLYKDLGTTLDGTRQTSIVHTLRDYGLTANVRYRMTHAQVKRCIDKKKLIISYLNDQEHWVVYYGYGANSIFVIDSAITKNQFEYNWVEYRQRTNGFGIVVGRKK